MRRELSLNFVFYNQHYDSLEGPPEWAKKALLKHQKDRREYIYSLEQLENVLTHNPSWNTTLHLNNKYELDGRDPNGFAGEA